MFIQASALQLESLQLVPHSGATMLRSLRSRSGLLYAGIAGLGAAGVGSLLQWVSAHIISPLSG